MRAKLAEVGARGFDSWSFSSSGTMLQADAMRAAGMEFFVGYLGAVTPERLGHVLSAGMAFMPVTFGGAYDGGKAVAQVEALGLPQGVTVWLDLEGEAAMNPTDDQLIAKVNAWASAVDSAGYEPGLYVGSPQPFSSDELWSLKVRRYWNALSSERDREGRLAEPRCGWAMYQMYPSVAWRGTGILVDVDVISADYLKRLPTWAVK